MSLPCRLYSAKEVKELDRIAIDEFDIAGFVLMRRAAKAVFDQLIESFPTTRSVCVACGTGNNGGDGYLVATLAVNAGLNVSLIQLGDVNSITGDALLAREAFLETGTQPIAYDASQTDIHFNTDVVVDALFGTGLDRNVEGDWAIAIDAINQCETNVIAVDIPSGLNADTGIVLGCCVKANITVSFIGLKKGLVTGQARDYTGSLKFNDLQVPAAVYKQLTYNSKTQIISNRILSDHLKPRPRTSHKGHFGHILFIGGAKGMSGAIRLSAEAGLRSGAGLVSVATHPGHADFVNMKRPEFMASAIHNPKDLEPLIAKASVLAIGPGLGQTEWAHALLSQILKSEKPKILDADALNLLSTLDASSVRNDNWILTPHPAEASRLLGIETTQIEHDRYRNIAKMHKKWGGVILLKGAGSLVFNGIETNVCMAGNPGMASGGMGDVLTGVIASLVAQGLTLQNAATCGVYLHATAGDLAAKQGEIGMLASDLFPFLRSLVNNFRA
jgi:NAD(P)H-hydrate epimerase